MARRRKSTDEKARRGSVAPKKVVAEWNRPNPLGNAVDRLIGQLVPELSPDSSEGGESGGQSCDG